MSDELYGLPLSEFIAARDALAARLKAAGDKLGAAAVKKLAKPSVPAWAANQIVRWGKAEFERLQSAAATLREHQAAGALPQDIRDAVRAQGQALQACEQRTAQLLSDAGHGATPAVLQRVSHTLLALAYGASEARPGCLAAELSAPGFEALPLTLAPPIPHRTPPALEPDEEPAEASPASEESTQRQSAEREARRRQLQQAVETARESLAAAEMRLAAHAAHAADAERRLRAAQEQAEKARVEAAETRGRLADAQQALAEFS